MFGRNPMDMSGLGGLHTNHFVVKRKSVDVVNEPQFSQYMEEGTVSPISQGNKKGHTKMKRSTGRKRQSSQKSSLVGGKKRKLSVRRTGKAKKRTYIKPGKKKSGKQRKTKVKDRF